MRILITGGEGYIGNHLTESFILDEHRVTTIDSHFNSKPYDLYATGITRHKASVINEDAVLRAMEGVDAVYHLASRSDWLFNKKHTLRLTQTNVLGTSAVLAMARNTGVSKVIFTSSFDVYGNIVPAKEIDNCTPVDMIGSTKLAAEAICRGYYELGLEVVILRLFNVWGGINDYSVVAKFLYSDKPYIIGDGNQTRDFIHISDVVKALRASYSWDSAIYNIGTGHEVTIGGLWEKIRGEEIPEHKKPTRNDIFRICADTNFTEQSTGWKADVCISELNLKDIEYYIDNY